MWHCFLLYSDLKSHGIVLSVVECRGHIHVGRIGYPPPTLPSRIHPLSMEGAVGVMRRIANARLNQQTMGSNCARTIDVVHDIERRPTTTETGVAYDNSTWHVMNTMYINSTKETSTRLAVKRWVTYPADMNTAPGTVFLTTG